MFEITGDEISLLGTSILRTLIALLCKTALKNRRETVAEAVKGTPR
jgi:hypothetical protein